MFEKVSPMHPDKIADRISGAIVDLCYEREDNPRVACEVLLGHGYAYVITESSVTLTHDDVQPIVSRIAGQDTTLRLLSIPQDPILAANQRESEELRVNSEEFATAVHLRCGDNGIFKGMPVTPEQQLLTDIAGEIYKKIPYDGKYVIASQGVKDDQHEHVNVTVCQSHLPETDEIQLVRETLDPLYSDHVTKDKVFPRIHFHTLINPLGEWTGGPDVDSGATNRKLGSDMGDGVTGGGLHGKDLSKADVSVNIVCHLLAQREQCPVTACCAIGDESVTFHYGDPTRPFPDNLPPHPDETLPYTDIVEQARQYIHTLGGFEQFAEWGLIRPMVASEK